MATGPHPSGENLARRGVRLLLGRGLVTAGDVHRYGLTARDVSQSNGVALVELGSGRGFAVKDVGTPGAPGQGEAAREVALYRAAAGLEDVAGVVPRLLAYDEDEQLLVLEGLLAARRIDRTPRRDPLDEELAGSFGASLGAWHRASVRIVGQLPPSRPWLLDLDGPGRLPILDTSPRHRAVVDAIVADDEHRAAIAAIGRAWRDDVVMHGDVRFANVLVRSPGPSVLIDWEYAGAGDARWDVAGAVQEYLSAGATYRGPGPVDGFLAAYAAARGAVDRADLAPFVAGRLLVRALQLVGWSRDPNDEIARHRELARAVAGVDR